MNNNDGQRAVYPKDHIKTPSLNLGYSNTNEGIINKKEL